MGAGHADTHTASPSTAAFHLKEDSAERARHGPTRPRVERHGLRAVEGVGFKTVEVSQAHEKTETGRARIAESREHGPGEDILVDVTALPDPSGRVAVHGGRQDRLGTKRRHWVRR